MMPLEEQVEQVAPPKTRWCDTQSQRLIDLAKRAVEYSRAHPKEFNMNSWISEHSCGTAFCIGGRMAAIADPTIFQSSDPNDAALDWIRANVPDALVFGTPWRKLFICGEWPKKYQYWFGFSTLAERFEHWLETGE